MVTARYNPLNTPPPDPKPGIKVLPPATEAGEAKKVSFGGIARKSPASKKTEYPVLPDPTGETARIAGRIVERREQIDAIEGALEVDAAELKLLAIPFYFRNGSRKLEVPSSVSVQSERGEVLVTFQNRYKQPDEAALKAVLGQSYPRLFRRSFELSVDGDKLPADTTQELVDELQQLFARFNALDALTVKETLKPVPDFHQLRHLELSPDLNLALHNVFPATVAVKTKGRRK